MANEYTSFPEFDPIDPKKRVERFVNAPLNFNALKPFFFPQLPDKNNLDSDFEFEFPYPADGVDDASFLGTPIYDQIIIGASENNNAKEGQENTDLKGKGVTYFDTDENKDITVPPIVINNGLITVRQGRNIVKTQLVNANGTIKEYVSDNDFEITINGAIEQSDSEKALNGLDVRPDSEIQNFVKMCKVQQQIPIASTYLNNLFGITEIVIEGYQLGQKSGGRSLQFFSLTCTSDSAKIIRQNREDITE